MNLIKNDVTATKKQSTKEQLKVMNKLVFNLWLV